MTTPEKERAVCEAYRRGDRTCDIARRFNVSSSTVVNIARRNGVPLRSQGRPRGKITREDAERFAELLRRGYSHSTAANRVGRSVKTILTACDEFDIHVESDTPSDQESYARLVLGYNRDVVKRSPFGLTERSIPIGIS